MEIGQILNHRIGPNAQEYTEEFREIAKGNKSKEALPAAPITLINQRPVNDELPVCMRLLFFFVPLILLFVQIKVEISFRRAVCFACEH